MDLSTNPPTCSRYAGQDGTPGYVEGRATEAVTGSGSLALFNRPYSIIMDPNGVMYVADKGNSAIRKISTDGHTVGTLCGGTVGPTPPTEAQLAANPSMYSPTGTVTFAAGYTAFPQVIRFFSDGNIMLGEDHTTNIREINLSAGTIRWISQFGYPIGQYNGDVWLWADVDSKGAIGPVDDIIFCASNGVGSAAPSWRASRDGTYSAIFVSDAGDAVENGNGAGHYPWAQAVSKTQGRYISTGIANIGIYSHRIRQSTDAAFVNLAEDINYQNGLTIYLLGTVPSFPYGLRPSFAAMHGVSGQAFIGTKTFSDLWAAFPSTTPGDSGDINLGAYIQAGMDGTVPRPEITGNDLRDLIYFIRRTALEGSNPTPVGLGPQNPDTIAPVISKVVATRLSTGSDGLGRIQVTWTTDKNTIGLAAAGSPSSQTPAFNGVVYPYSVWSPLDSGFAKSHSVIITGVPTSTPTHYAVLVKDIAGNYSTSPDAVI